MNNNSAEIVEFINRRFPYDESWEDGNCFYFALILCYRFKNLKIVYLPIVGHFVAMDTDNNIIYDIRGIRKVEEFKDEDFMIFDELPEKDIVYYNRIVRDCIL